jgi:hypothetical protein
MGEERRRNGDEGCGLGGRRGLLRSGELGGCPCVRERLAESQGREGEKDQGLLFQIVLLKEITGLSAL